MPEKNFLSKSYNLETEDDTLAHYEAWAETYDQELSENDYAQPQRCAAALINHVDKRDIRILDIGCGTGLSGVALKNLGFSNIDGCDFSSLMIEKAKDTNVYKRLFEADINKKLEIEISVNGDIGTNTPITLAILFAPKLYAPKAPANSRAVRVYASSRRI